LAGEGALDGRDDVFWLNWDEVLEALHSRQSDSLAEKVASRKAQHAAWLSFDLPPFLGLPQATLPDRPPLQDDVIQAPPAESGALGGLGASPDRTQGRARIVLDRRSLGDPRWYGRYG